MYINISSNIIFRYSGDILGNNSAFSLRMLIFGVACILIYFGSTCVTYLQVRSVIFIKKTLSNFWQNPC